MADDAWHLARHTQQFVDIDARVITHGIQHVDGVFAADVAAGARCVGAAAQTAQGAVKPHDPTLHACQYIGQAHAAGIVKVQGQLEVWARFKNFALQRFNHAADLRRVAHAGGVADGQSARPEIGKPFRPVDNALLRHVTFHRAPKSA